MIDGVLTGVGLALMKPEAEFDSQYANLEVGKKIWFIQTTSWLLDEEKH